MGRPSVSAYSSRRPAWAKSATRYNAVISSASTRAGKPGGDYGMDNFTYDPEKVSKWQMPENISAEKLPEDLYEASKDWILAGAAIDTALERIQALGEEAAQRAFPTYTHEHLLASRRLSEQGSFIGAISELSLVQSNTSTVASTPATSFSLSDAQSSPPKLNTAISTSNKKYGPHPNQLPESITSKPGMESPPFTPITRSGSESSSGARSPAILTNGHKDRAATPDFKTLSAQLSPLMSPSSASFTSVSDIAEAKVDTAAWSNYLNAYKAELSDLQKTALPRLRGHEYTVQKTLFELRANPPKDLTWEAAETVFAFAEWWKEAKDKGKERERVITSLTLPRLEDVVAAA